MTADVDDDELPKTTSSAARLTDRTAVYTTTAPNTLTVVDSYAHVRPRTVRDRALHR